MPPRNAVDVRRIKQLAAQGVKAPMIARRAGVSAGAVYAVLRKGKK